MGFTLLELILVIWLISLLAVPVSSNLLENLKKNAVSQVIGELEHVSHKARLISTKLNTPVYMILSYKTGNIELKWDTYDFGKVSQSTSVLNKYDQKIFTTEIFLKEVRINGNQIMKGPTIVFTPDGNSDFAEITFEMGSQIYKYTIKPSLAATPGENTGCGTVIDLDNLDLSSSDVFK